MIIDEEDELFHYGTPRHSGRYPWGSGGNEDGSPGDNHKNMSFLDVLSDLKSKGLSDKEIYEGMGITSTQYRARRTIARAEKQAANVAFAQRLKDKGTSTSAIARQMGIPESTARSLLAPGAADKAKLLTATADHVQKRVDANGFVDVGLGSETLIGISKEKLGAAIAILQEKGYQLHSIGVPNPGTKFNTNVKVLTKPGTTWGDTKRNQDNIVPLTGASEDGGRTYVKIHNPISINANRVAVKYGSDGGAESDGVIYVRPGVPDVSIGAAHYAQVRIQVGEGHFLKGMAVYSDDLPKGTDLLFNTSKSDTGNKFDAMKPLKEDKDLPFESIVRQITDGEGDAEHVTSVMNIMGNNEGAGIEGGWSTWSKTLSSQFLSKQKPDLAKAQLGKTLDQHEKEFERITSLTNPTIKRSLLEKFADSADSNAVSLDAAALSSRQAWHVILPLNSLKPTEVYAPQYNDGEKVVLIRHPHGGTFELPELTVNNKNPEGRKTLGDVVDAVGIHHSVAQRLSGADFDGDTVIVVPNGSRKITTSPALEGLKNFDPRASYPEYEGMQVIGSDQKQHEMGYISNLITDMTIKQAPHSEIVRAIRHSMVVIDAEKHKLNYKQSFIDNGIADLKRKYQSDPEKPRNRGASTLISRAGSELRVPERDKRRASKGGPVDTTTGRVVFEETGNTYTNKAGKTVPVTTISKKLAETEDAHTLSSGTPVEKYYADHSNAMKDLANRARLAAINTPRLKYSKSAKKVYSSEVAALNNKLALAIANKPRERQAQVVANAEIKLKRQANPSMTPSERKKVEVTAITNARNRLGASKRESLVHITDDEWDAIQAGAITENKLSDILSNTDVDRVRELATPKRVHLLTPSKTQRAKAMLDNGFTRAQVAKVFGVSLSTLDVATKGAA